LFWCGIVEEGPGLSIGDREDNTLFGGTKGIVRESLCVGVVVTKDGFVVVLGGDC
jgi:hypothetical protein